MAFIVYMNTGDDDSMRERDLFDIDAAGFLVDMSAVVADRCGIAVAAASRPALQRVLRRMAPGVAHRRGAHAGAARARGGQDRDCRGAVAQYVAPDDHPPAQRS